MAERMAMQFPTWFVLSQTILVSTVHSHLVGRVLAVQDSLQTSPGVGEPPSRLAKLIEAGNVEFSFYDLKPADQVYDGETRFKINVDYNFRFQVRQIRSGNSLIARVTVNFTSLDVRTDTTICLPRSLLLSSFWESQLVRHEFQHVQISSDPRVALLAKRLLGRIRSFDFPVTIAQTQGPNLVADKVEEAIANVVAEVTELVQQNNNLLDTVTKHGVLNSGQDPNFFRRLYTESNLKDQKFPSTQAVKTLLNNPQYQTYSQEPKQETSPN